VEIELRVVNHPKPEKKNNNNKKQKTKKNDVLGTTWI
jgi:hypothetical protein